MRIVSVRTTEMWSLITKFSKVEDTGEDAKKDVGSWGELNVNDAIDIMGLEFEEQF